MGVKTTYLEEFLVTYATVKDLLDEHLLIWIFKLCKKKPGFSMILGNNQWWLTAAINSSACESNDIMTGLNVLMQVCACSSNSENFILDFYFLALFKSVNFDY